MYRPVSPPLTSGEPSKSKLYCKQCFFLCFRVGLPCRCYGSCVACVATKYGRERRKDSMCGLVSVKETERGSEAARENCLTECDKCAVAPALEKT
jgi:hypothetical protein